MTGSLREAEAAAAVAVVEEEEEDEEESEGKGEPVAESTTDTHRLAEDFERAVGSIAATADYASTSTGTSTSTATVITADDDDADGVVLLDDHRACARVMGELIERKDPVAVDFEGIALSRTGKMCLA